MQNQAESGSDRPLSMRLDLYLDREPVTGRVRTDGGADERFVGWLGFVDAVKRLYERSQER